MRKNDWDTFEKMYHQLLKQLDAYGITREQGQTLSAYAKYVDASFGETHMRKLTAAYEKGLYGNNREGHRLCVNERKLGKFNQSA